MNGAAQSPAVQSLRRIGAMILRHTYLMRTSWPRIFELMYWPTIQMILWGFITRFLLTNSSYVAQAAGVLVSAVLLWDVLFRGQLGFSLSFLEEVWSRNLGNLSVSPLRPYEFLLSLMAMSLLRTVIGVLPAAGLAIVFYEANIFTLGLPLIAFFSVLIMFGWAIGMMVCALILRVGLGAENVAWLAIFLIAPVSAIYYPVSILPEALRIVVVFDHTARGPHRRVGTAQRAGIRRHACDPDRRCGPVRLHGARLRSRFLVSGHRRRTVSLRFPRRAAARPFAADRRVAARARFRSDSSSLLCVSGKRAICAVVRRRRIGSK